MKNGMSMWGWMVALVIGMTVAMCVLCPGLVLAADGAAPVVVTTTPAISVAEWIMTALVGVLVWVFRLGMAKPKWAAYEGMIITAIKWAEKAIPDDSTNKSVARANAAMQLFIQQYAAANGKPAPDSVIEAVRAAMPIVHAKLEANGNI